MAGNLPSTCTWVLLAGLPGTGKSTLAAALAARLQSVVVRNVVLNKDDIRAALFPGDATDYSEAQNSVCMDALLAAAGYLCSRFDAPRYILIDGRTFSKTAHIDHVLQAADAVRAASRVLYLWCPDETAAARLSQQHANHPAKNRNEALYRSLKVSYEPIRLPHFSVDTSAPLDWCVDRCAAYVEERFGKPSRASDQER